MGRFAIEFGNLPDCGLSENRTEPQILTLNDRNHDSWTPGGSIITNLDGMLLVAANSRLQKSIQLSDEAHFSLLWLKYSVLKVTTRAAVAVLTGTVDVVAGDVLRELNGTATAFTTELIPGDHIIVGVIEYRIESIASDVLATLKEVPSVTATTSAFSLVARSWYDWYVTDPAYPWMLDGGQSELQIGTPWSKYLKVSLRTGSDGRMLFGDREPSPINQNSADPVPVGVMQGYDYGFAQLPVEYLFPRSGTINLDFYNTTSEDLYVSAILAGTKVSV